MDERLRAGLEGVDPAGGVPPALMRLGGPS